MDAEAVINLFDSCWFGHELLKKQPRKSSSESSETNPDHQNQENGSEPDVPIQPTIIHVRSKSHDQLTGSMKSFDSEDYLSPDSVLSTPRLLQTILSGKVASEEELTIHPHAMDWKLQRQPKRNRSMTRRRKEKGMTKSLSDLEFEELKGFMDLGFVFSEDDRKDSTLVEIIPGLQRLGKNEDDDVDEKQEEESFDESSSVVARPYLSEAWGVWDRRSRVKNPLMNWRIPDLGNEIDIKDSLKLWAHTVASTVIS